MGALQGGPCLHVDEASLLMSSAGHSFYIRKLSTRAFSNG